MFLEAAIFARQRCCSQSRPTNSTCDCYVMHTEALHTAAYACITYCKKGKGKSYSITECRVPKLIAVLAGCYQFCCLVNRGTTGANSLPKTVTRQRRDCDLNPGRSAPECSTLTTRLPSQYRVFIVYTESWKTAIR